MKNKILSLNKKGSETSPREVTKKGTSVAEKNKENTHVLANAKPILTGLFLIIEDIFKPQESKNDAKTKTPSAKINAIHEKAVIQLSLTEKLSADQIGKLATYVGKTDPDFKVLLNLAVLSKVCRNSQPQQLILDFCAKAVSQNWILKHTEEVNIYKSLPQDISFGNEGYMSNLVMLLNAKYNKRINNIKEIENKSKSKDNSENKKKVISGDNTHYKNSDENQHKTTTKLNVERANVIAIAHLWGVINGKSNYDSTLSHVYKLLKNDKEFDLSDKSVLFDLVSMLDTKHRYTVAKFIEYFTEKSKLDKQLVSTANNLLNNEKIRANKLNEKFSEQEERIASLDKEVLRLQKEAADLRYQIQENGLDEKAKRVHLKDDAGKAKSRAYNILNDDTLTPLKLCLSALDRETPKTEVALHHIELIVENLEGELPWFIK